MSEIKTLEQYAISKIEELENKVADLQQTVDAYDELIDTLGSLLDRIGDNAEVNVSNYRSKPIPYISIRSLYADDVDDDVFDQLLYHLNLGDKFKALMNAENNKEGENNDSDDTSET